MLDRWLIELSDTEPLEPNMNQADSRIPYNIINNYFSIGVVRITDDFLTHILKLFYCRMLRFV